MKARTERVQLTLDDARKPEGHGGWRPNAGRPKGRTTMPHDARVEFSARAPVHVTWRLAAGVPSMRREYLMVIVRNAIRESHKVSFRIVEFNVLANHMHLIIEGANKEALARGLQGLAKRLAVRLNAKLERTGDLFGSRYHARPLNTPREVKNALRYVLLNERHHGAERGQRFDRYWVDPFSSGPWFDGWARPIRSPGEQTVRLMRQPRPNARATTWLLTTGWRRWGLLPFDDVPGGK